MSKHASGRDDPRFTQVDDAQAYLATDLARTYGFTHSAEAAAVERMRLLARGDAVRARDAARAYLARYPKGFARAEAERLTR